MMGKSREVGTAEIKTKNAMVRQGMQAVVTASNHQSAAMLGVAGKLAI